MDTALLFALPLVGGLIFCSNWNYTRWRVAREDGHRLYFRAVFFGALIFALVAIAHAQLERVSVRYSSTARLAKEFIRPMAKEPSSASAVADLTLICFLSMLAGWPLARLLNLGFRKDHWLRQAIRKDALEAFLLDAADSETSIAVTMDDRKVYVGYLVESFDPTVGRKCILLLPLMSGYRDLETNKVVFTTFYTELYSDDGFISQTAPLPTPLEHLTAEDFITDCRQTGLLRTACSTRGHTMYSSNPLQRMTLMPTSQRSLVERLSRRRRPAADGHCQVCRRAWYARFCRWHGAGMKMYS